MYTVGCGCAGAPPAKFVHYAYALLIAFDFTFRQIRLHCTYKDLCRYPLHIHYQSWSSCSDVTNTVHSRSQATAYSGPRRHGYATYFSAGTKTFIVKPWEEVTKKLSLSLEAVLLLHIWLYTKIMQLLIQALCTHARNFLYGAKLRWLHLSAFTIKYVKNELRQVN